MEIHISGVDETFKWLDAVDDKFTKKSVSKITQALYESVKAGAGKHIATGTLERNIRHSVKGDAGIVWIDDANMLTEWRGNKVNYAIFVLFGTKAHKIEAKNKKALRFGLNSFIFRHSVHHPGYKGDDFLHKALKDTFDNIERILQ